ncbi:MAG: spermidine synthase [Verrucomicrobia bacterium]|nr:spermidine synthase [Verrucomicrobiota bacterium]
MSRARYREIGLYAIFFCSGICGLGYHLAWSRMFALGLGHELPGILATVAAFFSGLSLGAWTLANRLSRSRCPGKWYGGLELFIGAWGLLSIFLIPWGNDLALRLIGLEATNLRHWTIAFGVPFLVLLPGTTAMGATFPAMERFVSSLSRAGRCVGGLYAMNTFGAVAGTLLSVFLCIPTLGFRASLGIFALLNMACGVAALAMERRAANDSSHTLSAATTEMSQWRLELMVFATGLLGIGYEVVGLRALAEVLENTIYTFAAVLSIFLLGTAIGAALYQRFGERFRFPWNVTLRGVLIGMSASCLGGMFMLSRAEFLYEKARSLLGDGVSAVLAAELAVAAAVFGLPALFMGAAFSQLVQASGSRIGGIGRALGFNTLGSALAPAVFGVLLFPAIGAKWTLVIVSLGYLALLPQFSVMGCAAWFGLTLLALATPSRLQFVKTPPRGELLEYREGVMSSVAVVKHFDGNRSLLVNNRFTMGGTGAANAARRHAHIPLLLHPAPRRALFLGLGTGISFAGANPHPNLDGHGVELVPEILEVYHHFRPHNDLRSGLSLHVADARRFVRVSETQYDVIVADLFHPARDGAGALYTAEHFQAIRRRLSPQGLFCQWLPLYQLDESMLRVITRTVLEVFPHTRAFLLRFNIDTPVLGLIASSKPSQYPAEWLGKRLRDSEQLATELRRLALADEIQLFGCYVAGPDALRNFSANAPLNRDDRPVVAFGAPQFSYRRHETPYDRLFTLLRLRAANPEDLISRDDGAKAGKLINDLKEFIAARDMYLEGLRLENQGRLSEAIDSYVESARLSPYFSTGYAHCLTLASQQAKANPEAARRLLERVIEVRPERPVARDLLQRLFEN